MAKKPIKITEVVLRDAHQSLLATRMTMDEMRPILPEMDKIPYFSVECWGGATFDSCIRFLDEDPWERLRILRKELPHQKLQMLFRGQNMLGYRPYADDAVEYFVKKSVANGIDVIRIFDALNDARNLQTAIKSANKEGAHVQGCISYTLSPVHNNEYYVKYAKTLEEMGANSICIKDMAGLLTPYTCYELVKELKNTLSIPVDIHSHYTAGLASMSLLKGIEAGADIVDTAMSPLSGGTSHMATESLVAALQGTDYDTGLDLKQLNVVRAYFAKLREKYIANGQISPKSLGVDANTLLYQVPGGMFSNMLKQLKDAGKEDKLDEVLAEIPRVREDAGYPPLVTPTSQIVGAGGVSVAIGELADGLYIDLNKVTKKYDGLDGTELAISESQERMAVALAPEDVDKFIAIATEENLEATPVAKVTEEKRLNMVWNGKSIVNISREFLNSNGAEKHQNVHIEKGTVWQPQWAGVTFEQKMKNMVGDLNVCSKKGLSERFDSTIGAATVLMPFGGACQLTPQNAMVAKLPVDGETNTCSGMAWGYNPYLMSANQYVGARMAVVESVTKLVASGFRYEDAYLTFQEYFERLGTSPERWGKPLAALLGALDAQIGLGIAAIGGKDSMSGSFEQLDVPPTLVSFATAIGKAGRVVSTEFKKPESTVVLIRPILDPVTGCPNFFSLKANYKKVEQMMEDGMVAAASSVGYGGLAEALFKMGLGNRIGFKMMNNMTTHDMFKPMYGSIVLEMVSDAPAGELLGETTADYTFECCGDKLDMAQLQEIWESKLEPVYPYRKAGPAVEKINGSLTAPAAPKIGVAKPKVIIPVFPGTNCEYDTAHAFARAGADPEVLVIRNLTPADVTASCEALVKAINESQIVMLPGGFSGGDEPDGSAKFIASFFRNPAVTEAVRDLLQHRDGLMLGICNGFQALIKLGLAAYGDIRPITACDPTLTFNTIGRHQSMLVRTRIASTGSPWLSKCSVGDQHTVAISHGEGRFVAPQSVLDTLIANGQIATQYVDQNGSPSMDMKYNPNGSVLAIEGITSPDGRVFGKMGHSERSGEYLYKNVTGDKYQPIFEGGVDYFKI